MKKIAWTAVPLCMLLAFACSAMAQEGEGGGEGGEKPKKEKKKKEKKPKKPAPKAEELTLNGKVTAVEKKRKDKTFKVFLLVTADGAKINLPKPRKAKGKDAPEPPKLEDFVDKDVTVVGMGVKRKRGEKEIIMLRQIKSITAAAGGGEGGGEAAGEEKKE